MKRVYSVAPKKIIWRQFDRFLQEPMAPYLIFFVWSPVYQINTVKQQN